jgi:flagellar hook-basal body complex protein FliE
MNTIGAINTYLTHALPQGMDASAGLAGAPKISDADVLELSSAAKGLQAQPAAESKGSFSDVLRGMVHEVNAKQQVAGESVGAMLSGGNVPLHQTMIAMEEASVSFQLMVEVRNKLLESYQEMMRMQV